MEILEIALDSQQCGVYLAGIGYYGFEKGIA